MDSRGRENSSQGDAAEPGNGSSSGSQEGGSSSSAMQRASAAGPVHTASINPMHVGDTIMQISKHRGKTYDQIVCEHPDFVRWAVNTAAVQEVDPRLAQFVIWAIGSA